MTRHDLTLEQMVLIRKLVDLATIYKCETGKTANVLLVYAYNEELMAVTEIAGLKVYRVINVPRNFMSVTFV